ncbi:hypothetical protein Pelo_17439 [Pelomyxa schiedti]|nr:hypothetical protein Pelo_17439 [Pelomyxa schiedti]
MDIAWTMTVSQVVWDHVIVPALALPSHNRGRVRFTTPQCRWLLGVAEALFPLVPRACRLLADAAAQGVPPDNSNEKDENCGTVVVQRHTSRYFVLSCAGAAGSTRCITWTLRNKATTKRNNRKECLAVLRGLCAGGHIEMAQQLVDGGGDGDGGDDGPWSGCSLLRWPRGDPSLIDDIREVPNSGASPHSVLYDACKGGNLDVVKWVMSKFRGVGTEPWELPMPFHAAVRWGHLDVVKWLASTTGVIDACTKLVGTGYDPDLGEFIASPSLEVMKYCTDLFFCDGKKVPQLPQRNVLFRFVEYSSSSSESDSLLKEGCTWILGKFSLKRMIHLNPLVHVENVKGFKWAIENLTIKPTKDELYLACTSLADEYLVKWLLENYSNTVGSVTVALFKRACGNRSDSVSLVELLFLKLAQPLTPPLVVDCLVESLYHNNTAVADWLERKFHVMDHINTRPTVTEKVFCAVGESECVAGVQWFLSQCTVINISEEAVTKSFSHQIENGFMETALLLWEKFDVSRRSFDKAQAVSSIVYFCDVSQAQKFMLPDVQFSVRDVVEGLSKLGYVQSGKVVKWLIQHFHLNAEQVKSNNNHLLGELISSNKPGCAEWLIHTFHVTLSEVVTMVPQTIKTGVCINVATWRMLLRVFPEITGPFAMQHFESFVCFSPLHVMVSIKMLGLTLEEISPPRWIFGAQWRL